MKDPNTRVANCATDVDYLDLTRPLPVLPLALPVGLVDLVTARLDAVAQEKANERRKVEAAETLFRRYTVRLMADLFEVTLAHPGLLQFIGAPCYELDTYGIGIIRRYGKGMSKSRVAMVSGDTPSLVRFETDRTKNPHYVYDLESLIPHGSDVGFARPYSGLLEDLASWIAAASDG